jgi:ASC-1-like (ASCH) protein
MKKLAIMAAAVLCVSAANAAEFKDLSISEIKTSEIAVPVPTMDITASAAARSALVTGEITKLNLLAQTSKSQLFTYAENQAQFDEFKAMWQPILEKFGMKVTGTAYKNADGKGDYGVITYSSPDGRVLRTFMAEKLHYNALDAAAMAGLRNELTGALQRAGMTPVASFDIKNEIFRPTFNIYYLTKPEENMDHEVQLRQLMNGDDIDFDLLAGSVSIVKQDTSFSLVYIGKELGFVSKIAADEPALNAKLADYKKFLSDNQKEFIASRTFKLDPPIDLGDTKANFAANVYFFQ